MTEQELSLIFEQGENTSNFWCGINNYTHPERIYNEIKKKEFYYGRRKKV